jgi:hypothetical protein
MDVKNNPTVRKIIGEFNPFIHNAKTVGGFSLS